MCCCPSPAQAALFGSSTAARSSWANPPASFYLPPPQAAASISSLAKAGACWNRLAGTMLICTGYIAAAPDKECPATGDASGLLTRSLSPSPAVQVPPPAIHPSEVGEASLLAAWNAAAAQAAADLAAADNSGPAAANGSMTSRSLVSHQSSEEYPASLPIVLSRRNSSSCSSNEEGASMESMPEDDVSSSLQQQPAAAGGAQQNKTAAAGSRAGEAPKSEGTRTPRSIGRGDSFRRRSSCSCGVPCHRWHECCPVQ